MTLVRTSLFTRYASTLAVTALLTAPLMAQVAIAPATDSRVESTSAPLLLAENGASLPDAPQPQGSAVAVLPQADGYKSVSSAPVAPLHMKYIPAGYTAQPITAHDKVILGFKDLVNPLNFAAMLASSGYEQLTNGSPNYGTDRGAFGQRLGAAAIRESTQGVFTDAVFAPLLHEDPRYYVMGRGHSFLKRAVYSATRPLITRTDSGRSTINGALLMGYASSSALSYTYYPAINQNFKDTASSFGGSIGGAAIGFVVSEFSSDLLQAMHLKKK